MLRIKEEYQRTVIGFAGSGAPLGMRSQKDLLELALLAHRSGHHKEKFDVLPSLQELQLLKMDLLHSEPTPKTAQQSDGRTENNSEKKSGSKPRKQGRLRKGAQQRLA